MRNQILDEILIRPATKFDILSIAVKRIVTDVNGVIVSKNTLPANMQSDYPVYLFNEFDRQGGYNLSQKNTPIQGAEKFFGSFVWGVGNSYFWGFTGLSEIQNELNSGDLVNVYTDDLTAPNYFVFIVQTSSNNGLGSIIANTKTDDFNERFGKINTDRLQYYSDNVNQYNIDLQIMKVDMLGNVKADAIQPYSSKTVDYKQNQFIQIPLELPINQYYGVNTYMSFDTNALQFNFRIKKIF